jgi:hypothetical protein
MNASNDNSDSDSDSELSCWDELCDVDVLYGSSIRESNARDWTFIRRSNENKFIANSQLARDEFSLENNSTDKWLLEQTLTEINHILHSVHVKLHDADNNQRITPVESFVAALPYQLLNVFSNWLKAGSSAQVPSFTFGNICVYLKCEFKMKCLRISESILEQFGVTADDAKQYKVIREAMTKADKPASQRKVVEEEKKSEQKL